MVFYYLFKKKKMSGVNSIFASLHKDILKGDTGN